jgi:hypothetical protein
MIGQLVVLLVICVIIAMIWWVCDYLPVPEPLNKLIKIVSVVIGCIAVIYILLAIAGMGGGLPALK